MIRIACAVVCATLALAARASAAAPTRQDALHMLERGYSPEVSLQESRLAGGDRDCDQFQTFLVNQDPVGGDKGRIEIAEFRPKKPTKADPVLIMPPTGGRNQLDDRYAERICQNGRLAVIVMHWTGDDDKGTDWELHNRTPLRAVTALRNVIDYLKTPKVGLLGTSLGAIYGASAFGAEPRIKAAVLIVGGGPSADVIATSDQEILAGLRTERFARFGFHTEQEYAEELRRHLVIDPILLAAPGAGKRALFMTADSDTTVPTANQLALWEAWGKPERVSLWAGHVGAIIQYSYFYREKVASFFESALR